jgi:hypothetical protein
MDACEGDKDKCEKMCSDKEESSETAACHDKGGEAHHEMNAHHESATDKSVEESSAEEE